ncbi:hypothetical protein RND81_11G039000 [Saponaria officinalis]|uniref:Uncharacterized protein n=1 Tax=Saponaria officinalis TaxID=3572 RepID=A0AAW1HHQ5_SAPOF
MSTFPLQATTTTTTLLLVFLFLTPSTTTADVVVDHEGDPLVAGNYYYAMPIATQKGGGLTMFNNGSVMCPDFIVARSTEDTDFGIPINLGPQTPDQDKNIHTSSNLSISFKYLSPQPLCRRRYTTVWAVETEKAVVVLDGEEGSEDSLFKLEKYGDQLSGGYKILAKEKTLLYDEQSLVGLDSGNPLLVVFVKA